MSFSKQGHYALSDEFKAAVIQLSEICDGCGPDNGGRVTISADLMVAYNELASQHGLEPDFEDLGGRSGNVSCPQLRELLKPVASKTAKGDKDKKDKP